MRKNKKQSGVTLIEVLMSVFLLSVISVSLYGMFLLAGRLVADAKLRLMGTYAANEEMEDIKSMSYDQIGTAGGIPSGTIDQDKTVDKGGYTFQVETEVRFGDDPADLIFPDDTVPTDYKIVRLSVSWPSAFKKHEVVLISSIYPDVPEEDEDGGVLSINAIDFAGNGVATCDAEIVNTSVTPQVSIHTRTDDQGNIMLLGVPPSTGYKITLSKASYETVETFPPYPETAFRPVDENASVVASRLNMKAIQIDELGLINVTVVDEADLPRSGFSMDIFGGRVLGNTVGETPTPIYSYNESNILTDGNGVLAISDARRGTYTASPHDSSYEFVAASPENPFSLAAGTTLEVRLTAVNTYTDALVVHAMDLTTRDPIPEASITVSGEGYSATKPSDSTGSAFFWVEGMGGKSYDVSIDAEGFASYSGAVEVHNLTSTEAFLQSN